MSGNTAVALTTDMSPATGSGSTNFGISAPGSSVCGVTPWAPAIPTTPRSKNHSRHYDCEFPVHGILLSRVYCSFFEQWSRESSLGMLAGMYLLMGDYPFQFSFNCRVEE